MHSAVAFGSVTLLTLAMLAFWPTYLSKPFATIDSYTHIHAAAGVLWLSLLFAQALLVRAGRRKVHRAIGRLSYAAALYFFISSLLLAHYRFSRMDATSFAKEAYTLYLPISAALLYAFAYALAIGYRRNVRLHARFMASTGLTLLDPVVGRVLGLYVLELPEFWQYQVITFAAEGAILAALTRSLAQSPHELRTFQQFSVTYATVLVLWFFLPHSSAWFEFAAWFRQLSLT